MYYRVYQCHNRAKFRRRDGGGGSGLLRSIPYTAVRGKKCHLESAEAAVSQEEGGDSGPPPQGVAFKYKFEGREELNLV